MAEPFVPVPHGTALSDCARRNPSEIQSRLSQLPGRLKSWGLSNRLRKNYCGTVGIQWPAHLGQQEDSAQDAQKGQTSHPPNPWRAKTRLVPSKAAASEEARRTLRYVEPLSEARTPLADFFSILLNGHSTSPSQFRSLTPIMLSGHCCPRQDLTRVFLPVTN